MEVKTMNIRKLWENELKTKEQVIAKMNEMALEYNNYKRLGQQYNWQNNKVYKDTCKNFENNITIFKEWAIELCKI